MRRKEPDKPPIAVLKYTTLVGKLANRKFICDIMGWKMNLQDLAAQACENRIPNNHCPKILNGKVYFIELNKLEDKVVDLITKLECTYFGRE